VRTRGAERRGKKGFSPTAWNQFSPSFCVCKEERATCLLPVPVKRPSAFHLCKMDALDGFKSYPAVSPVSLQGPLLFYRISLAVPAPYLKKVTVPAELLSRSLQLWQLPSCLVLPWTAAFKPLPGCRCAYVEHPNSSFPLPEPVSRGDRSLLSGRRHKGSQNNSAAEEHRSWSLHSGSYSLCKELKQLQKAGMLWCEMG